MDKISKVATPIGAPKRPLEEPKRDIGIDMFIEDENSCRGPLRMEVDVDSTVGVLKRKVEDEFGIGSRNQARKGTHATLSSYSNYIPNFAELDPRQTIAERRIVHQ